MGRANILSTRTINYMELIGNGKVYKVPAYQRDYAWHEEEWEDLWNDIIDLHGKPDEYHYMGALVVEGKSDREFMIIDGQQRMATLSILALAVMGHLHNIADRGSEPDRNRERADELRNRFIGEKDPASLQKNSRLCLNDTDNPFYQDYLIQHRPPLNPRGLPKSNRRLWDCVRYFQKRLEEKAYDGMEVAKLLSETVGRQFLFILIAVDDELNAYTVFETLNARGLQLTTTDLLKNYLFARVKVKSDLESLMRRWRSLIARVTQEDFPKFLGYHLLCEQSRVRSERIFKIMRDRVKDPHNVFALLDALEGRAEIFAALSDPNHGYWMEYPDAKRYIREMNLFKVCQATPLLFAAWERLEHQDFPHILKLISVISFRYTIVSGLNTNALEPIYSAAAQAMLHGEARSVQTVFNILEPIYVQDKKFIEDFALLSVEGGQRKKLAKYILCRLEEDVSARACDPDTDPSTIEHLLPENPTGEWEESFPRGQWENMVDRLGNLTLLEPSLNRQIGNTTYGEKKVAYARSAYGLTRKIPEMAPEQWTPELIEERQREMAKRAVHLWRWNSSKNRDVSKEGY